VEIQKGYDEMLVGKKRLAKHVFTDIRKDYKKETE